MADTFETGGGVVLRSPQGYSFDLPDFTDLILDMRQDPTDADTILKIIETHKQQRSRMLHNYRRYKTDVTGVPIFSRSFERDMTIDNRINNDYFSEVVDIKTGYFAGKTAAYSYDKNEPGYEAALAQLSDFLERNRIPDVNMETTKYCAIAGYAARLLYIDPQGNDRIMYIPGHQAILLNEDGNINETEFGIRYYGEEKQYVIHVYTDTMRYKYKQDGERLNLLEEMPHGFALCPLIGYANNDELMGDVDKVLTIIDAIDRTTSDVNSEIEAFRLAYLLFLGYDITQEQLDQMKNNGALGVPADGLPGATREVKFLEKNLNDKAIENHLNRLHDAVYRFTGTPDLADEAFSGSQSGESLKFKLFGLETKCARFEQKFKAADTRMFEVMATKWRVSGLIIDPFKVFAEFKRNFPQNILHDAQVQKELNGLMSTQTRLGLFPGIDDVEYEMALMDKERDEMGGLFDEDVTDDVEVRE